MTTITSREAEQQSEQSAEEVSDNFPRVDLGLATATSLQSCRSYLPNDPP